MKSLFESYVTFCSMLENPANHSFSFEELCARLRVSPMDLNEILREELGCSGMELLAAMQTPVRA